jgi:hypothetical protein
MLFVAVTASPQRWPEMKGREQERKKDEDKKGGADRGT